MKVYVVKMDTADRHEPANWVIDKVFLDEDAARKYAAEDPTRQMECHETVEQFRPLKRIESRGF